MNIVSVLFVSGYSSFYFDDQKAIKSGVAQEGFIYAGDPQTQGFSAIRQAGECVSILLTLEDGSVAVGDCAAVQYSGAGGRDPLFLGADFVPFLKQHIRPLLEGRSVDTFLDNARYFDTLEIEGRQLHTAIRYGISQALLDATALSKKCLKAEVICAEYDLPVIPKPIPLFGQTGDDRYNGVDKMILKNIDVLPHGLINNIDDKLGRQGEKLDEYIRWIVKRIEQLAPGKGYTPDLHIDVYGTLGLIFDHNVNKIASYIAGLENAAGPLNLYIEGPVDAGGRDKQVEELGAITRQLAVLGSNVKLVADEWCNTFEDIVIFAESKCCHMVQIKTPDLGSIHNIVDATLVSNLHNMEAYQGGTCNETDISARACVHIALAARPMRMLVKPGMGFDEGMTIVSNEMNRSIALLKASQL